jgi:antitoxin component of RelBE/YafQ-DinJ toxin-antitoxin module
MQKTVLQIPMSKQLKDDAEKAAFDQGFSSLQEVLRVFMKKFANNNIDFSFKEEEFVKLSKKAEKRYAEILKNIESGKEKVYKAKNVDDFIEQLTNS